ncbi:uncharacterized protein EV420DRAFT_1755118, partial [Desarmillaria tabescens]
MSCLTCSNCGFVNLLPPEAHVQKTLQAIQLNSDDLVLQLLRGSRPLLDADRALLDAEIAKLERLRSLYDVQLQEIQTRRRPISKALEDRTSIYAPIRRLPRDILTEIFHSVCECWRQEIEVDSIFTENRYSLNVSGPLWVLGRVCGLWRDTLHSSPVSWARDIVLKSPFSKHARKILQTYLEHTGEHPLSLSVDCYDDNSTEDHEIMSLVVQSCCRWKKVYICTDVHYMHHLESISYLPVLQMIEIDIIVDYESDCHLGMCLNAPQLWRASLPRQGIHQVGLPSSITHYSGRITCLEDFQLLSHLPKLITCHLRDFWTLSFQARRVEAPVTMAELRHLYVNSADYLNFLTAPLLQSLTISEPMRGSVSVPSFLRRSGCHLENLSYNMRAAAWLSSEPPVLVSNILSSEACSTVSRLKLELDKRFDEVAEALTSLSVLPNLRHLILCVTTPVEEYEWNAIPDMIRFRRDAGLLKAVELQITDYGSGRSDEYDITTEIKGLAGDNLEMRIEEWNSP